MSPFISANDGIQIERPTLADKPGGELTADALRSAMDALWNETRMPLPLRSADELWSGQ